VQFLEGFQPLVGLLFVIENDGDHSVFHSCSPCWRAKRFFPDSMYSPLFRRGLRRFPSSGRQCQSAVGPWPAFWRALSPHLLSPPCWWPPPPGDRSCPCRAFHRVPSDRTAACLSPRVPRRHHRRSARHPDRLPALETGRPPRRPRARWPIPPPRRGGSAPPPA